MQFGIDPVRTVRSLRGLPRYVRDVFRFRAKHRGRFEFKPCLFDWYEEGGITKSEYFWQDLLVARMIYSAKPEKHVDIGSRVDGFVAHVASFRDIEVLDIRPISASIPGVTFKQADLMKPVDEMAGYCDSLSCLHALEHFGLGRYGDPVDPQGFELGLANMARLVKEKGYFYLSVPIGIERVEFNANRVFDPRVIINCVKRHSMKLAALTVIQQGGNVETFSLGEEDAHFAKLANQRYALGIFSFTRISEG